MIVGSARSVRHGTRSMLRSLMIGKRRWKIRYSKDVLLERMGACDADESTIWIFDRPEHKDPLQLFSTFAHEILHARNPKLSEKAVVETELALIDIARKILDRKSTNS